MLTKACRVSTTLRNTGVDCDINMGPTAMLIAVPRSFSFGAAQLASGFSQFIKDALHDVQGQRIYPIFGADAPIRFINNNKEADVVTTLDDGLPVFIRYGFLNRQFSTTSGGLCYAAALQSFTASGYRILEFDKQNHMLARDNKDGTYGGLRTDFMFSPSPDLPDFRNPWKTNFQVSFDPTEYVGNGAIFTLSELESDVLGMMGLIDAGYRQPVAATTTLIVLDVFAACSEDDLIAEFGAGLAITANWTAIDKATGLPATISGATIVGGTLHLAGTFTTAHTYIVRGDPADVWYNGGGTPSIEGYDFYANPIEVTIP